MTAAVLYGKEDVKIEKVPIPRVGEGEALIKVQVALTCTDLDRARSFYRDTLGLPLSFSSDEFAFLRAGAVTLGLREAADLLDPREDGGGQHDVVPADPRRVGEAENDAAHRIQ